MAHSDWKISDSGTGKIGKINERTYNLKDLSCSNLSIVFRWSAFDDSLIFNNRPINR